MSLTWPDHPTIERLNRKIYETQLSPFGVATYNHDHRVNDFVGRREELDRFKEQIKIVAQYNKSRAIRLEGPQGVGKSTLFNFLKESLERERSGMGQGGAAFQDLFRDINVFSAYFNIPDQILDFSDIWKPLFMGLYPGFEMETGFDISYPEYVAYHLIFHMLRHYPDALMPIIWEKTPPLNLSTLRMKDIIDPIQRGGSAVVKKLQAFYIDHKRDIRDQCETTLNGIKYEIRRNDTNLITNLFRTLDEDDPEDYLEAIRTGAPEAFKNNEDLVGYFNDLSRLYTCITKKRPLFLIGIDEFAKSEVEGRSDYFHGLGNLMVKLRNSLDFILFVFISTTENWRDFDAVINQETDLAGQISGFLYLITLKSLPVDDLIQVFRNRMNRFWDNYAADRSALVPNYPFNDQVFQYVYQYFKRRLRESINFLNEMWIQYRSHQAIPKLETLFETLQEVHRIDRNPVKVQSLQKFEWEIINKAFNDPQRFKTNGVRSGAVEKGMEKAWAHLMRSQYKEITLVQNNPTIYTSTHQRRPDVLVTLHGNLGAEFCRHVEFQIKAYLPHSEVELDHIASSLELYHENYTDFIYFIITGKGLSPEAEAAVKRIETECPSRIRRPPLNEDQTNAIYLLALFPEVFGYAMESAHESDSGEVDENIKILLEMVLNQKIESFLSEIRGLTYRTVQTNVGAVAPPQSAVPNPPTSSSIPAPLNATIPEPDSASISLPLKFSDAPPSQPAISDPPIPVMKPAPRSSKKNFGSLVQSASSLSALPSSDPTASHPSSTSNATSSPTSPPSLRWLQTYPDFLPYRLELGALGSYLRTRESSANRGKFTLATVEKNVITVSANLDKKKFRAVIKLMVDQGFVVQEKTSYKLTATGDQLYTALKQEHFSC